MCSTKRPGIFGTNAEDYDNLKPEKELWYITITSKTHNKESYTNTSIKHVVGGIEIHEVKSVSENKYHINYEIPKILENGKKYTDVELRHKKFYGIESACFDTLDNAYRFVLKELLNREEKLSKELDILIVDIMSISNYLEKSST